MMVAKKTEVLPGTDLGDGIRAAVVEVTPALAKKWLEMNHPDNRDVKPNRVTAIARDMTSGNWRLTHQGAAFDAEGRLIDAQHRLHAIIESGVTVKMLVIWNSGSEYHDPIDRMQPRNVALLMGKHHRVVAALGVLRCLAVGYKEMIPMTVAEADELWGKYGEQIEDIQRNVPNSQRLPGGVLGACAYALPVAKETVIQFARQVTTGEMITKAMPAFAFRVWRERNVRINPWEMSLAALGCLRAHILNIPLSNVYIAETGYRKITMMRRARKVPYTPGTDLVPSSGHKDEDDESEE